MQLVFETLNTYEEEKFFFPLIEKYGKKEDDEKEEKVEESGEEEEGDNGADKAQKDQESDAKKIVNKVKANFKAFKTAAKDNIKSWKNFFEAQNVCGEKMAREFGGAYARCYRMYDSNYVVVSFTKGGQKHLGVLKAGGPLEFSVESDSAFSVFGDCVKGMKKEALAAKEKYVKQAEEKKAEKERMARKEKLGAFLGEDLNESQYLQGYYEIVMEELQKQGYTFEEADFIMGEGHYTGETEKLATDKVQPEEAAKILAKNALNKLDENLNEGAEVDLIAWIVGTLGVIASAGGIAYLQDRLAKSKNKKVRAFAKGLEQMGSGAAAGARKGPGLDESKVAVNEGAEVDLIAWIVGTLGVIASAGGIAYLQDRLAKSKNKKVRAFAKGLEQMGSGAASGARKSPGLDENLNEGLSPEIVQMIGWFAGALAIPLSGAGIALLQKKMRESKNKKVRAMASILDKMGSSASSGIKGGTTSMKESLNEELSPDSINIIQWLAGMLGVVISGASIGILQKKMQASKNKQVQKMSKILGQIGSAASGSIKGGTTSMK